MRPARLPAPPLHPPTTNSWWRRIFTFRHVVDLNRRAAEGEVTESAAEAGDEAVVLSGANLHMGIVRHGERIVTVLVRASVADARATAALLEATAALRN